MSTPKRTKVRLPNGDWLETFRSFIEVKRLIQAMPSGTYEVIDKHGGVTTFVNVDGKLCTPKKEIVENEFLRGF